MNDNDVGRKLNGLELAATSRLEENQTLGPLSETLDDLVRMAAEARRRHRATADQIGREVASLQRLLRTLRVQQQVYGHVRAEALRSAQLDAADTVATTEHAEAQADETVRRAIALTGPKP